MRILPVMDLMGGKSCAASPGAVEHYRPVVSRLCTPAILSMWRGRSDHFGLNRLYLADLDAIAGAKPTFPTYADLMRDGFRLWIDAGVSEMNRIRLLADAAVEQIVVGLETAGPAVLAESCRTFGDRLVFSLDLKGAPAWRCGCLANFGSGKDCG